MSFVREKKMDEWQSFRRPTTRAKLVKIRMLLSGSPKMGPTHLQHVAQMHGPTTCRRDKQLFYGRHYTQNIAINFAAIPYIAINIASFQDVAMHVALSSMALLLQLALP